MSIVYVGGVTGGRAGATGTTTQSLSGTLTGGVASSPSEGDLVVVYCSVGTAAAYVTTSQTISGNNSGAYSNLTFQSQADTNYSQSQFNYQIMGATPDTSLTIPSSGNIRNAQRWNVLVFRGVDTTTPLDTTSQPASGPNTGRPSPAAITPVTAGAWIAAFYASAAATGAAYTSPGLSGWIGNTTVDTYDCMNGAGYYSSWTTGPYTPPAITAGGTTGTGDSWTAMTIALRPGPQTPSVFDSVTVTENVSAKVTYLLLSVFETITVTENVQLEYGGPKLISVYDTITVEDKIVYPDDTIWVREWVSLAVQAADTSPKPSVFDTVTITENVTIKIPALVPSVFDAVTITENVTAKVTFLRVSVSDRVEVQDANAFLFGYAIFDNTFSVQGGAGYVIGSKFTTGSVVQVFSVTAYLVDNFGNASHNSRVGIYDNSLNLVAESSQVSITGSFYSGWTRYTFTSPVSLSSGDYWLLYHNSTNVTISYTTGSTNQGLLKDLGGYGSLPASITTPTYSDRKYSIYAQGSPGIVLIPEFKPSVFDAITVIENVTTRVSSNPLVFDTITVTENVTLSVSAAGNLSISVNDSITVTDQVVSPIEDAVSVTENVTVKIVALVPSVFDSVAVAESVQISYSLPSPEFETVTVTENVTVKIVSLVPSVFDAVTVAETVTVKIVALLPSVFDAVTVAETVTVKIVSLVPSVFDAVTVAETVRISYSLPSPRFDSITVTESVSVVIPVNVSVFESITVTEVYGFQWSYAQNFNSFTDGQIDPQDGWNNFVGDFDFIGNYTPYEGAKDLKYALNSTGYQMDYREITSAMSGVFSVAMRTSLAGSSLTMVGSTYAADADGNWVIEINFNDSGNLSFWDKETSQYISLVSSWAANTWYVVYVDFDVSQNRARYKVNDGEWTSYYKMWHATSSKHLVEIGFFGDNSVTADLLFDTINYYDLLSVFDSITVTENVSLEIISSSVVNVSVYDTVTVTEFVGRDGDTIYVTDYPSLSIVNNVSVFDAVTVSENITFLFVNRALSVFDSVAVTEFVKISYSLPSPEFETVTVTENVTVRVASNLLVFEAITVSEDVTVRVISGQPLFEAITVTENVAVRVAANRLVFDAITITENVNIRVASNLLVFDAVTTAEEVAVRVTSYFLVFDSVSITENITLTLLTGQVLVSVFDAVTVTEFVGRDGDTIYVTDYPTVSITTAVSVFDAITVAENVSAKVTYLLLSVNDAITVTENVTVRSLMNVSVYDVATIVDIPDHPDDIIYVDEYISIVITTANVYTLSVYDAITVVDFPGYYGDWIVVSENVTLKISYAISVFDAITVTENVSAKVTYQLLSVFDTVTVTENISAKVPSLIVSVFDTVTITENVSASVRVSVSVFDTVTITENISTKVTYQLLSVFDAITVIENVSVAARIPISVYDSVSVIDFPGYYGDWITVSEVVVVVIGGATLSVSVFDSVSISENVTITVSTLAAVSVSVFDTISVSDVPTVRVPALAVSVFDSVSITENLSFTITTVLSVFDTVSVAENITIYPPKLLVSVFDTVSVIDLTLFGGQQVISVIDTVTVSENVTLYITALKVSVFDAVTITENFGPTGTSSGSVYESIVVTESVSLFIPKYFLSVYDDVLVSEVITLERIGGADFYVVVNDTVGVTEEVSFYILVSVSVFDTITVTEQVTMRSNRVVSVFDTVTVSESITLFYPILIVFVYDDITVSERESSTGTAQFTIYDSVAVNENVQNEGKSYLLVYDIIALSERYKWIRKSYGYDIGEHRPRGHHHEVRGLGDIDDPNEVHGYGTGY